MKKNRRMAVIPLLLISLVLLMSSCVKNGSVKAEDLQTEAFMSHIVSGSEYFTDSSLPDELLDHDVCVLAAVVTNNSDKMYYMVQLEPVAYDKDGNVMEDAFKSFYFKDDTMTEYEIDKAYLIAINVGAGESALTYSGFLLADGCEEPDHIECKITNSTRMNSDITSYGLDVKMEQDDYGITCTVNNNSDTDYSGVQIDILPIREDGYIVQDGPVGISHTNEDGIEEPLPAHSSYEERFDYNTWDLSPEYEYRAFVEQLDYY